MAHRGVPCKCSIHSRKKGEGLILRFRGEEAVPHIKTKKKDPIESTCYRRGGESQCYTNSKAPVRKICNNVQNGIV